MEFSIRNSSSQSIDEYLAIQRRMIVDHWRSISNEREFYVKEPGSCPKEMNNWTCVHSYQPSIKFDDWERWYLPIGDSGYYVSLLFGSRKAMREANAPDYVRARQLFEGILDSVKIEKM
jgi:hypothetical protein